MSAFEVAAYEEFMATSTGRTHARNEEVMRWFADAFGVDQDLVYVTAVGPKSGSTSDETTIFRIRVLDYANQQEYQVIENEPAFVDVHEDKNGALIVDNLRIGGRGTRLYVAQHGRDLTREDAQRVNRLAYGQILATLTDRRMTAYHATAWLPSKYGGSA